MGSVDALERYRGRYPNDPQCQVAAGIRGHELAVTRQESPRLFQDL
jgi:hypothetical protein